MPSSLSQSESINDPETSGDIAIIEDISDGLLNCQNNLEHFMQLNDLNGV